MRRVGAVDIGGTRTKVGIVGEAGRILRRDTTPTPRRGRPAPLIGGIVAALRPMLEASAAEGHPATGIGVSVAGFLDRSHGAMVENANLPELCSFPLRDALEEALGLACFLEVDSNAAVLAEHRFGAGRGSTRLLDVTVGTGLGGGVIIDGSLLRHTGECAGDLGHIIVDPAGRACTCGARGCLEAMVCSAALSERAGGRPVREIVTAAQAGDRQAVDALATTGWWLGLGLASLTPLFSPDRIVVSGGVAAAGDALLDSTRRSYAEHAAPASAARVRIVGSSFDGWEGLVGAATLPLDHPRPVDHA